MAKLELTSPEGTKHLKEVIETRLLRVDYKGPKNLIGLMVREGNMAFVNIDRSIFQKTKEEKKALKNAKHHYKYQNQ